ncbi:MAG: hypothetical protein LBQ14_07055 [Treponema sp.]|nr:hypothetical protein [Treponema sp.]
MTFEDVVAICTEEPKKNPFEWYNVTPINRHVFFDRYSVLIDEREGLCQIMASGKCPVSNGYGNELKSCFFSLVEELEDKYGQGVVVDELLPDSIYTSPRDWVKGLSEKERILECQWEKRGLDSSLETIRLRTSAYNILDSYTVYIGIVYTFTNNTTVYERERKNRKSVL